MLTEYLLASIAAPRQQKPNTTIAKDAAIFLYELQPHAAQRSIFKKSATAPGCLAVTETHIFAAQADKAVVAIYSREQGNQQASVAFQEKITALTLTCRDTVLVLGTEEGRLYFWEILTGRITSTSQAHLGAVTALAAEPSSNLLISGSADASLHVWSIPRVLSFSNPPASAAESHNAPLHTLSGHRDAITALVMGRGTSFSNIAISASKDSSCIIWDYNSNNVLRTILLPDTPLCLALDPADRALYCGYDNGSVHFIDLNGEPSTEQDPSRTAIHSHSNAALPLQPDLRNRWEPPSSDVGATLSVELSYDGTKLISGHESGKIIIWDAPTGRFLSNLASAPMPGPVTNLQILPISGFPGQKPAKLKSITVAKPRFGEFDRRDGQIPAKYTISAQSVGNLRTRKISPSEAGGFVPKTAFETALTHSSFPPDMLSACIADLELHQRGAQATESTSNQADFMSLDAPADTDASNSSKLQQENDKLKEEIAALRRLQKTSFAQIEALRSEKKQLLQKAQVDANGVLDAEMADLDRAEKEWSALGRRGTSASNGEGRKTRSVNK
ncbi:hypothetical protein MBLNU457_g2770t1 [Dothideomycetes sp. NU457]